MLAIWLLLTVAWFVSVGVTILISAAAFLAKLKTTEPCRTISKSEKVGRVCGPERWRSLSTG